MPSEHPAKSPARTVYRIAELTSRIKALLQDEIGAVWVEGEVSNAKQYGSGHIYFTLKDESAQLSAVMFRNVAIGNKVPIKDGAKLRAYGELTVYEQRGNYQLIVRRVEDAGVGDLQRQFEELKARLAKEGLFDAARKRKLPRLPRTIAIVTSPTGAVIRDILHVLGRRYPDRHILLAPVLVQGPEAANQIAHAIGFLNTLDSIDVIIVGRGGGSLEDLWAFNEEVVARAVFNSRIPIISAVGHETDFTICDFVADVRAPTPSAAAEIVVEAKANLEEAILVLRRRLAQSLRTRTLELRNRFTRAARSYVFREPQNLLNRHRDQIKHDADRLRRALELALANRQQRFDEATLKLSHTAGLRIQATRHRIERAAASLRALGPDAVLARGYSITLDPAGLPIRDLAAIQPGAQIQTLLAQGKLTSTVTQTERRTDNERTRK